MRTNFVEYVLQDNGLSWNTSTPDLSKCFQKSVLLWIPCGFLWLCFPFLLIWYRSQATVNQKLNDKSSLNIAKLVCNFLLIYYLIPSFLNFLFLARDVQLNVVTFSLFICLIIKTFVFIIK